MMLRVAVTCCLQVAAAAAAAAPKHIMFLMIDDLGYNDVSYRNASDLSSPNIDALALGGVRLERYYTHNLCSPSRTSFLSGRFASTMSMQGCVIVNGHAIDLPKNVSTVADRLGKGNWKSAAFGKWVTHRVVFRFIGYCFLTWCINRTPAQRPGTTRRPAVGLTTFTASGMRLRIITATAGRTRSTCTKTLPPTTRRVACTRHTFTPRRRRPGCRRLWAPRWPRIPSYT
jgi:hypothetical protein